MKKLNFFIITAAISLSGAVFAESFDQTKLPKELKEKPYTKGTCYIKGGYKGGSRSGSATVALGYRYLDTFGYDLNSEASSGFWGASITPLGTFYQNNYFKCYAGLGIGANLINTVTTIPIIEAFWSINPVLGVQLKNTGFKAKFIQLDGYTSFFQEFSSKRYYSIGISTGFGF